MVTVRAVEGLNALSIFKVVIAYRAGVCLCSNHDHVRVRVEPLILVAKNAKAVGPMVGMSKESFVFSIQIRYSVLRTAVPNTFEDEANGEGIQFRH